MNHSVCIYLFVLTYFVLTYFVPKMIVKIGKRPGRIHCKKRCDISVFNGTMAHGACLSRSLTLCQTAWTQIRPNILSRLFWVQTVYHVYKSYQLSFLFGVKQYGSRSGPAFCQNCFMEVFSGHPYLASNGMDPDQDQCLDEPSLGPNCL